METKIEVTPELLADLRKKAEKINYPNWYATQDGWGREVVCNKRPPFECCNVATMGPGEMEDVSSSYIAAANPAVILALIHHIEHLEKQTQWLATAQNYGIDHEDPTRCPKGKEPPQDCCSTCAECWLKAAKEATD